MTNRLVVHFPKYIYYKYILQTDRCHSLFRMPAINKRRRVAQALANNKRRRVAQAVMLMTAVALTSEPSTKKRRTCIERIEDTYTHSFEELYVADALLCIGRGHARREKTPLFFFGS
jgi:hypothetical protein